MKAILVSKVKAAAVVCAAVLVVGMSGGLASDRVPAADAADKVKAEKAPVSTAGVKIISWSNTKTKDKDQMFLVKPKENITFSVKVEGAHKCQWQMNKKVDKKATGNSFTWTVPNEKGIWEIHLKATADGKEVHQEWVVSTLPKKDAPDFIEYFAEHF